MNWKTLKEYIPLLSVLSVGLIILGMIKQMIYYSHFNIQIQYYISPSELFLVLADEMMLIIFFVTMMTFMAYTLLTTVHSETEQKLKEKQDSKWKIYRSNILVVFLILSVVILLLIAKGSYFLIILCASFLALFLYPIIYFESASLYQKKTHKNINKKLFQLTFSVFALLIVVIMLTYRDIGYTENEKYFGTKISTKDSTYVSDKNHFYIGKTQNYYFIVNKDSSTLIIPEREVTKFDLRFKN